MDYSAGEGTSLDYSDVVPKFGTKHMMDAIFNKQELTDEEKNDFLKEAKEDIAAIENKARSDQDFKYKNKPSIKNQFDDEKLWTVGFIRAEVLNLSDKDQFSRYNELLKFASLNSPRIIIVNEIKKFYEGSYIIFIIYRPVLYKVLFNKK